MARPFHWSLTSKETLTGVEPALTGLQPVALPSGSNVMMIPERRFGISPRKNPMSRATPGHVGFQKDPKCGLIFEPDAQHVWKLQKECVTFVTK